MFRLDLRDRTYLTRDISEAIYPYETCRKIKDTIDWDDDFLHPDEDFILFCMEGPEAMKVAAESGLKIHGSLSPGVFYIFRENLKKDALVPYRVSYSLKTLKNYFHLEV